MRPRVVLILCEGLTEKLYFTLVTKNKRTPGVKVSILEKQGQHRSLIKKCVEKRQLYAKELEISEDEIEVWAVCDKDSLNGGYLKLKRYADTRNVQLAFSDPQFETFLIQHFEYKKVTDRGGSLEHRLSKYIGEEYNKTDLAWLDKIIDEKPATLTLAIQNAEKLSNHTKPPFLTVQKLTIRLLELSR